MSSIIRQCGLNSLPIKLWIQTVHPQPMELLWDMMTSMKEVMEKPHSVLLHVWKPYWNTFLSIYPHQCVYIVFLSGSNMKKVNFTFPLLANIYWNYIVGAATTDKLEMNLFFFWSYILFTFLFPISKAGKWMNECTLISHWCTYHIWVVRSQPVLFFLSTVRGCYRTMLLIHIEPFIFNTELRSQNCNLINV